MNTYMRLVAIVLLFTVIHTMHAQERSAATMEGATILSGTASITSQGSENSDNRYTVLSLVPSLHYFVSDGVGLGGDVSLTHASQGDASATQIGIGPKISYFFDKGSNTIPYLGAGASFLSQAATRSETDTGWRIKLGGGLLLRKDHLGFVIEAGFLLDSIDRGEWTGTVSYNTIYIAFGFAGLFF
ncbi:porin family protein [bacterium]|nr:porin family protein [bacterium]